MLLLHIKYSMCDLIYDINYCARVREQRNCDMCDIRVNHVRPSCCIS